MRSLTPYLKKINQVLGKEEQIKIIMREVDFEKIHEVMTFLDWKWFRAGGHNQFNVPTIDEIKASSLYLLNEIWELPIDPESQINTLGSGGIMAERLNYDGLKMLSLRFELTGWSFDYDDVQSENYN